ncbi:uncharacterized protein ACOB7L_012940 isoform 1-T2 [Callospermophilus lateralis]|uniref:uncharacterized protein LOC143394020 n=1 Tax=Callospermophilus lateralis TaxID=76772 RepID=UPI004038AD61
MEEIEPRLKRLRIDPEEPPSRRRRYRKRMKKDQIDPAKKLISWEDVKKLTTHAPEETGGFPNTSRPRRKQDPSDDGSNSNCPTGLSGWRVFRTRMQKLRRVNRRLIFAKRKGEYVGSHSHT